VQGLVAGVEDQNAAGVQVGQRLAAGGTARPRAGDEVVVRLGQQAYDV